MSPPSRSLFPRRRALLRLLVAAAALGAPVAVTACSTTQKEGETGARPEQEPTTILVENRSFLDHNVYVLRGSQRIRLGTVTGNRSQRFTIPANLVFGVSALQFLVDPIGGSRTPISDEIRVAEGDEVRLVIPP